MRFQYGAEAGTVNDNANLLPDSREWLYILAVILSGLDPSSKHFMPEKQNQTSEPTENERKPARVNPEPQEEPSFGNGKNEPFKQVSVFPVAMDKKASGNQGSAIPEPTRQSGFRKLLAWVNAFLDSLDEEPEPPPPPEKPLKESVREFLECCRAPEKRIALLKAFGEWCWTMFFRGAVFVFLFILTIWGTIWALDFSENHRIKFYPPDEVVDYLTAEHESLEAAADRMTPSVGRDDNVPFDRFDKKFIETVRPVKIYSDEYGVYFMTSKDWYNGEHGIFITKDEENMPEINWGLIEGRIYTYAIYD